MLDESPGVDTRKRNSMTELERYDIMRMIGQKQWRGVKNLLDGVSFYFHDDDAQILVALLLEREALLPEVNEILESCVSKALQLYLDNIDTLDNTHAKWVRGFNKFSYEMWRHKDLKPWLQRLYTVAMAESNEEKDWDVFLPLDTKRRFEETLKTEREYLIWKLKNSEFLCKRPKGAEWVFIADLRAEIVNRLKSLEE